MLDFETLRVVWWVLIGVLFIGFAVLDGFDMGAAILLPILAKTETERSVVLNTIRPVWEGNQVWIILGAGAIFAAWPIVYAVAFSGPYFAVLLLLLTMGISRPVSFKYRTKIDRYYWRRTWDWLVFVGGIVPAFTFGVLVGNLLVGLPFYLDNELRINYSGTFFQLFNPFAIWCGLTAIAMLTMHGGIYVAIKTESPIRYRAIQMARFSILILFFLFAGGGVLITNHVAGYQILNELNHYGPSNPLHKEVGSQLGAWLNNYKIYPLSMIAPVFAFFSAAIAFILLGINFIRTAFIFSATCIASIISTVGVSMFPFILPSSINLSSGLTVWDSSSSRLTLLMMFFATCFFMPLILIYTSWVYRVLRGPVREQDVEGQEQQHVY